MSDKFDFTDLHAINWMKGVLHDKSITDLCITFTKSDGTERKMHCTLDESRIPQDKLPKGTGRSTSDETQRVFDVDKQEWRSFRWDAVKEVTFTMGE